MEYILFLISMRALSLIFHANELVDKRHPHCNIINNIINQVLARMWIPISHICTLLYLRSRFIVFHSLDSVGSVFRSARCSHNIRFSHSFLHGVLYWFRVNKKTENKMLEFVLRWDIQNSDGLNLIRIRWIMRWFWRLLAYHRINTQMHSTTNVGTNYIITSRRNEAELKATRWHFE